MEIAVTQGRVSDSVAFQAPGYHSVVYMCRNTKR